MNLDRTKPFGKIAGDFTPDGCDRPAAFEQSGRMFDAHGRLIEPGKPASIVPSDDDLATADEEDMPSMTVADLLRRHEAMHWRAFKKQARLVLGQDCPATKAPILEALAAAQAEFDARAAKRKQARVAPVAEPPPTAASGVDLAAWARGHKEYLWGDVRKAMKLAYGRNVSERDDAVEFLVGQGVITVGEARQDVIRAA